MEAVEQSEQVTIKFDSQDGQVDAVAAASTMIAITNLASEVNQSLNRNKELLIKARPFNKGSLEIPLDFLIISASAVLAGGLVQEDIIDRIIEILKRFFELKNTLLGKSFERHSEATIVIQGEEINIGTITAEILDPKGKANQAVATAFENIEKDKSIEKVELYRGSSPEPFARIERHQYEYYQIPILDDSKPRKTLRTQEFLGIASIVFEGKSKWRFNRQGMIIVASIEDSDFLNRVQGRIESFAAGDRLLVDLVTHQEYDYGLNDYINKRYAIEKVWEHERRISQKKLFDESE